MATLKVPVGPADHSQGPPAPIVKALQKKFGKQLRFVFRNFPLREIRPNAEAGAETVEFAGQLPVCSSSVQNREAAGAEGICLAG